MLPARLPVQVVHAARNNVIYIYVCVCVCPEAIRYETQVWRGVCRTRGSGAARQEQWAYETHQDNVVAVPLSVIFLYAKGMMERVHHHAISLCDVTFLMSGSPEKKSFIHGQ